MVFFVESQNTKSLSFKTYKKVSNLIEYQMGDSGKKVMLGLPRLRREVGRPKVFENRQLIEHMLKEHPSYTSIDVQRDLLSLHSINVSRRTLQRRISEIRCKEHQKQVPKQQQLQRKQSHQQQEEEYQDIKFQNENDENGDHLEISYLTEEAKKRRLNWALAHQDWTVHDWRNIFNMDDIKFIDGDTTPKEIYVDTLLGPEGTGNGNELNLLEQLMAIIEPKIEELPQAPKNVDEFRRVLYDVWHSDQEMVDRIEQVYESMSWRVASVIQSGGDEPDF